MIVRDLSVGFKTGDLDMILFNVILPRPAAFLANVTVDTEEGSMTIRLYWFGGKDFLLHYAVERENGDVFMYIKRTDWEEMMRDPTLHPLLVSADLITIDMEEALKLSAWLAESAQAGRVPAWLDPYNGQRWLDP